MITNMEEVSSSSAQRATSPFKEVGWRRCSGLERIRILCDVAKGRATGVHSPSPVTRPLVRESAWAGVTLRDRLSTPCGPPHGHGTLDVPGRLQHLLFLVMLIYKWFSRQLQQLWWCYSSCSYSSVFVLYFERHDSDGSKLCPCGVLLVFSMLDFTFTFCL